jgi:hypothetical protein
MQVVHYRRIPFLVACQMSRLEEQGSNAIDHTVDPTIAFSDLIDASLDLFGYRCIKDKMVYSKSR